MQYTNKQDLSGALLEMGTVKKQLASLYGDIEAAKKELATLEEEGAKYSGIKADLAKLKKELNIEQCKMDEFMLASETKAIEISNKFSANEEKSKMLQDDIGKKVAAMNAELNELSVKIAELKSQKANLEGTILRSQDELNVLATQIVAVKSEKSGIESELKSVTESLELGQKNLDTVHAQLASSKSLTAQLTESNLALQARAKQLAELDAKYAALDGEYADKKHILDKELTDLAMTLKKQETELVAREAEVSVKEQQLRAKSMKLQKDRIAYEKVTGQLLNFN